MMKLHLTGLCLCLASIALVAESNVFTEGDDLNHPRPNILVIFGDDVGTGDVPGYWNTGLVDMPNLEKFVQSGTILNDAHSTPLCAPSRYVFLFGNYQHRGERYQGTWNLNYKMNQFRDGQQSIANVLKSNGYETGMFGKWHLGGRIPLKDGFVPKKKIYPPKMMLLRLEGHDWSKPFEEGPWDIGFKESYITPAGVQNPPYAFYRDGTLEITSEEAVYWYPGNHSMPDGISILAKGGEGSDDWDSSAYNKILVNETEIFIDNHLAHQPDKPFFAYVALGAVHFPHSPPNVYLDGSPIAGQYDTLHMDVLGEVDKVVGSLVDIIEKRQIANNTIIVFASDNGGLGGIYGSQDNGHLSNGPLRGSKGQIYEGGHLIPMMFRWDGKIPKNETRSNLVGLSDMFSTLCELAGVEVPDDQAKDSISFANHLFQANVTDGLRRTLGTWRYGFKRLLQESLHMDGMKLIYNFQNETYEMYDLLKDKSETNDIYNHTKIRNRTTVDTMEITLHQQSPCYDRRGRFLIEKKKKKKSLQMVC